MPTMGPSPVPRQTRAQSLYEVGSMCIDLLGRTSTELGGDDLRALGIDLSLVRTADSEDAGPKPWFFAPFPADQFAAYFERTGAAIDWPSDWGQSGLYAALDVVRMLDERLDTAVHGSWYSTSKMQASPFEPVLFHRGEAEEWQAYDIYAAQSKETKSGRPKPDASLPHVGCVLVLEGPMAEDKLLRGELICITALMADGLRDTRWADRLVPVILYSFAAKKARVLEAYYDKQRLVVRTSELLDFENQEDGNAKLMLRWLMATLKGDTMSDLTRDRGNEAAAPMG